MYRLSNKNCIRYLSSMSSVQDLLKTSDNSFIRELSEDKSGLEQHIPRQLDDHYARVIPDKPPNAKTVIISDELCDEMNLLKNESQFEQFLTGVEIGEGCHPWATAYGCHHRGSYMGQMGDGRAMSLCEVSPKGHKLEIQLKGAGRTPFNRTFDGKCVIRSCVREFLMSEHLHALGIPTTRALAVFYTGDSVIRQWYNHNSDRQEVKREDGALTVRVASSFLRFGHFELFWRKESYDDLVQLADYAAVRNFNLPKGEVNSYIKMFENIVTKSAKLVASWMGVGYVHGNMNSDNMSIDGLTLDFGPFGMMEDYKPFWNSWVATPHYGYSLQPTCMERNCTVLSNCFKDLLEHVGASTTEIQQIADIQSRFYEIFTNEWNDIIRKKLGLREYNTEIGNLWSSLTTLMEEDSVDFTTLFRTLCDIGDSVEGGIDKLIASNIFRDGHPNNELEWKSWLEKYIKLPRDVELQKSVNPSIVLRNYFALEAYTTLPETMVLKSIHEVLKTPYSDSHMSSKYYGPTPDWAVTKPGVHQTT